jgi:diphthine-ammonia ligase
LAARTLNGGYLIMQNAAMLWTGGKDSSLALFEASRDGYCVQSLLTFAPPRPEFLAHPVAIMKLQAEALGLRHLILPVAEPFDKSYEAHLHTLRNEMGIDVVITGDIAEVGGSPNWIRERSRPVGMQVHTPLWGRDRETLLADLSRLGFEVRFSCIKKRWLTESWVGRVLDDEAVAELRAVRERTGLDLCGEEGEYHTLVTNSPQFARPIRLGSYSIRTTDSLAYMEIHELELA